MSPRVPLALVPAAYLLLLRPGERDVPEVLLQLRQGTGYMDGCWACGAAGHVEPGESVLEAVVREAAEELGVEVDPAALRALTATHRSNDVGGAAVEQRVDFFFTTWRWRGEPEAREPGRSGGLAWFPLDALPGAVPPHERMVMGLLLAEARGGDPVPAVTVAGFPAGATPAGGGLTHPGTP